MALPDSVRRGVHHRTAQRLDEPQQVRRHPPLRDARRAAGDRRRCRAHRQGDRQRPARPQRRPEPDRRRDAARPGASRPAGLREARHRDTGRTRARAGCCPRALHGPHDPRLLPGQQPLGGVPPADRLPGRRRPRRADPHHLGRRPLRRPPGRHGQRDQRLLGRRHRHRHDRCRAGSPARSDHGVRGRGPRRQPSEQRHDLGTAHRRRPQRGHRRPRRLLAQVDPVPRLRVEPRGPRRLHPVRAGTRRHIDGAPRSGACRQRRRPHRLRAGSPRPADLAAARIAVARLPAARIGGRRHDARSQHWTADLSHRAAAGRAARPAGRHGPAGRVRQPWRRRRVGHLPGPRRHVGRRRPDRRQRLQRLRGRDVAVHLARVGHPSGQGTDLRLADRSRQRARGPGDSAFFVVRQADVDPHEPEASRRPLRRHGRRRT